MKLTEQSLDLSEQVMPLQVGPLKIGVVSDTHGEIAQSVVKVLAGSEIILHAGDVCGQNVLDQLEEITATVIAVAGNNDVRFTYALGKLPDLVHVKLPGGQISLLHGHQFGRAQPDHDAMRGEYSQSRTIIYGHSHRQVHDSGTQPGLLNPGAAGHTRTNGGASCAVISIRNDSTPNDSIRNHDWSVTLHREP